VLAIAFYAEGVEFQSPASRSARWENQAKSQRILQGFHNRPVSSNHCKTPLGFRIENQPLTQGAPQRRPWALELNAVGVPHPGKLA
jgi:hypothetical protein